MVHREREPRDEATQGTADQHQGEGLQLKGKNAARRFLSLLGQGVKEGKPAPGSKTSFSTQLQRRLERETVFPTAQTLRLLEPYFQ